MHLANEQMKVALIEAIHELFLSEDPKHSAGLIEALNFVRSDLNLVLMSNEYVKQYIWEKFRSPASMLQTLVNTTNTFLMGVDDIDSVIEQAAERMIPFKSGTRIVDDETLDKAVDQKELIETLKNNYWLFFVLYATSNMRIVSETSTTYIPKPASK